MITNQASTLNHEASTFKLHLTFCWNRTCGSCEIDRDTYLDAMEAIGGEWLRAHKYSAFARLSN